MAATKEQEREALEKIRKIVEELGADSYVGTAFEGCFEIAEENIKNDSACSMKQRVEGLESELAKSKKNFDAAHKAAFDEANKKDTTIRKLNAQVLMITEIRDGLVKRAKEAEENAIKNWNMFREQEDRADAAETEIMKLKAKLYDLIVKD